MQHLNQGSKAQSNTKHEAAARIGSHTEQAQFPHVSPLETLHRNRKPSSFER
jgi:hypothetical protein